MAQATCNAFSNNKYYVLGYKASFFNHNCAPNATLWMSENFILRFYAIEPIEAGFY
jgi:SET domain-containing protein